MKTPKIAAITLALLVLTACGSNTTSSPLDGKPAEQSAASINTPEHFTKTTTWSLNQELLQGQDLDPELSPNADQIIQTSANNIFYANLPEQSTAQFTIDGFTEDLILTTGSTPDGKHPLVLARGETTAEGINKASNAWKLFTVENQELKELGNGTFDTGGNVSISDAGIITTTRQGGSSSNPSYQVVSNDLQIFDTSSTPEKFSNCGAGACELNTTPVAATSSGNLRNFVETTPGRTCLKTDAITDSNSKVGKGCLSGFKTDHWNSYDPKIAPAGANPNSASIVAIDDEWVLGEWGGAQQEEERYYKLMKIDNPEDSPATFSFTEPGAGAFRGGAVDEASVGRLNFSSNHQHLATSHSLLDIANQKITSFDESEQTQRVSIQAISDDGTGYGTIDSEEPVEIHVDGSSTVLNADTILPSGFFEKDGKQYGVFIQSRDGLHSVSTVEYQK